MQQLLRKIELFYTVLSKLLILTGLLILTDEKMSKVISKGYKLTGNCHEIIKNAFICGQNLFLFWRNSKFLHTVLLFIYGVVIKSAKCPKYKS